MSLPDKIVEEKPDGTITGTKATISAYGLKCMQEGNFELGMACFKAVRTQDDLSAGLLIKFFQSRKALVVTKQLSDKDNGAIEQLKTMLTSEVEPAKLKQDKSTAVSAPPTAPPTASQPKRPS